MIQIMAFICLKCGKAFKVKYNLLRHEKQIHALSFEPVVKPVKCLACGKTYSTKQGMHRHFLISHQHLLDHFLIPRPKSKKKAAKREENEGESIKKKDENEEQNENEKKKGYDEEMKMFPFLKVCNAALIICLLFSTI